MRAARAVVGPALVVVGAVHVGLTPVLDPEAVRSVLDAGVWATIQADPDQVVPRSLAFWFATTGVGLVATGLVVTSLEHRVAPLPRSLPWCCWASVPGAAAGFAVLGVPRARCRERDQAGQGTTGTGPAAPPGRRDRVGVAFPAHDRWRTSPSRWSSAARGPEVLVQFGVVAPAGWSAAASSLGRAHHGQESAVLVRSGTPCRRPRSRAKGIG